MNTSDAIPGYCRPALRAFQQNGIKAEFTNIGGSSYILLVHRGKWHIAVSSTGHDGLARTADEPWDWEIIRHSGDAPQVLVSHITVPRSPGNHGLIAYVRSEIERAPMFTPPHDSGRGDPQS
ncbi:hypothetical protein [Nonomuraea jabiensis]|uniref:hypothetical protein n=1 Tax=Nonomuraea jabiensis TaxID=882448 RepID=UPI003D712AFD